MPSNRSTCNYITHWCRFNTSRTISLALKLCCKCPCHKYWWVTNLLIHWMIFYHYTSAKTKYSHLDHLNQFVTNSVPLKFWVTLVLNAERICSTICSPRNSDLRYRIFAFSFEEFRKCTCRFSKYETIECLMRKPHLSFFKDIFLIFHYQKT